MEVEEDEDYELDSMSNAIKNVGGKVIGRGGNDPAAVNDTSDEDDSSTESEDEQQNTAASRKKNNSNVPTNRGSNIIEYNAQPKINEWDVDIGNLMAGSLFENNF